MFNSSPTFFIKQNSSLPRLKFGLSEFIMLRYDISDDMLENCAVTFSMQDAETGVYRIANKAADLLINTDFQANPDDDKYNLSYKFSVSDTAKEGIYLGEFKVDFLGDNQCGKITFPNTDKITIVIQKSITKTSTNFIPRTTLIIDLFDNSFDDTFS